MSIVFQIANATGTGNSNGLVMPYRSLCTGWFLPSTSGSTGTQFIDYSPAAKNASISGTPTVGTNYTSFGGATSGQVAVTQINDTGADITLIAVCQSTDTDADAANDPKFITNFASNTSSGITGNFGLSLSVLNATNMQGADYYNNAGALGTAAASLAETPTNWRAYAFNISTSAGVTTRTLMDLTGGTSAVATVTSARLANITTPFHFGGTASNLAGGAANIALAAFYGPGLTPSQITSSVKPFVSALMAARGLTV